MKKQFAAFTELVVLVCIAAGLAGSPLCAQEADPAINQVPYLSTYYIEPNVMSGGKIAIGYYVTDYTQREYMRDDKSERFTINYWVNGAKSTVTGVIAGDNLINAKAPPPGKVLFALQATDSHGRKSQRLFQEFRVKDAKAGPADKALSPDLAQFGIFSDNTHPHETTAGLSRMMQWAAENGYARVVLPRGIYAIDETATVQMASQVTLDLNGSTLKLNPNALGKGLMLEFVDCRDSHLINGTLEGDVKEHDFKTAPNNSEWVNALCISSGSEYCSVENVNIEDITGYGSTTNHSSSTRKTQTYGPIRAVRGFAPGDIDELGRLVDSQLRTTNADLVPIKELVDSYGFIQLGVYLGYQGNPAGTWDYRAHYYDADKKYIETIEGCLYRRNYPPKNAAFARFTLLGTATPTNLSVYNFRSPYNCAFINVHHKDVRCVGMATAGFNNLLVQGNTFENCGWASAKCAFDAEDGWDMMQDLTFRDNVFLQNPHNELLFAGGHNFVVENNTLSTYVWDRNNSCVFRNNRLKSAGFRFGSLVRTGYPRISGNTIAGDVRLVSATAKPNREYCIRDNICQQGANAAAGATEKPNAYFYKCTIIKGSLLGKIVDCDISGTANLGGGFDIAHSRLNDCILKTSGKGMVATVFDSKLVNCKLSTQGSTVMVKHCTLVDPDCMAGGDWSDSHQWQFEGNMIETSLDHLLDVGNSFDRVVLRDNTITSTNPGFAAVRLRNPTTKTRPEEPVELSGNTFNARGGFAVDVSRLPATENTLILHFYGNTCNGLKLATANAATAANIKLDESKPAP